MKRDLYGEVSTRIFTELEAGRAKIVLCSDLIPDIGVSVRYAAKLVGISGPVLTPRVSVAAAGQTPSRRASTRAQRRVRQGTICGMV
jgi:hypothetical protein